MPFVPSLCCSATTPCCCAWGRRAHCRHSAAAASAATWPGRDVGAFLGLGCRLGRADVAARRPTRRGRSPPAGLDPAARPRSDGPRPPPVGKPNTVLPASPGPRPRGRGHCPSRRCPPSSCSAERSASDPFRSTSFRTRSARVANAEDLAAPAEQTTPGLVPSCSAALQLEIPCHRRAAARRNTLPSISPPPAPST